MDSELASLNDVDVEEGELSDSSEEVYTPLERPVIVNRTSTIRDPTHDANCSKMDADVIDEEKTIKNINNDDEDEIQSDEFTSSSDDSSDTCLDKTNKERKSKHKKCRVKRTVMVRVDPTSGEAEQKKSRFKKYDIWTAALQEDALTENMRGCDVTQNVFNDRNVENYDFSLRYQLNGENSLKRRLSNSNEDLSDSDQFQPHNKRRRPSSRNERLGKRRDIGTRRRSSPYSGGSDSNSYNPKYIEDLENVENRLAIDIAREMAMKLHEEKDDLLVRVVEVLGTELPLKIYKETQRIESEGGMTIKNGQRRRTPGGVFLFLLKHDDSLSAEDQKAIFLEDRNNANKKHKNRKAIIRDRKVEELKKRLCEQSGELPNLNTRKEIILLGADVSDKQNKGNCEFLVSNPPPSPESYEQNGVDIKSMQINHVANDASDKPSTSQGVEEHILQTYGDEFLDVSCGDMDLF